MGKISRSKINEERLRYYHLHRECVRRNPDYARGHQELKNIQNPDVRKWKSAVLSSAWGLWNNDLPDSKDRPDLDKLKTQPLKTRSVIYLPGDFSPDPDIQRGLDGFSFHVLDLFKDDKKMLERLQGLLVLIYFPEEPGPPCTISAINTRWSKKDMIESLKDTVESIIIRRQKHGLKQARPSKRLRLEECFDYLKVYDLRKVGKKFREIAEQMWPAEMLPEDGFDSERKARVYYKKAEAIILNPPILQLLKEQLEARLQVRKPTPKGC